MARLPAQRAHYGSDIVYINKVLNALANDTRRPQEWVRMAMAKAQGVIDVLRDAPAPRPLDEDETAAPVVVVRAKAKGPRKAR